MRYYLNVALLNFIWYHFLVFFENRGAVFDFPKVVGKTLLWDNGFFC